MLFKKGFIEQTINGVKMGNGTISFKAIKLNVHCFAVDGVLIDTGAISLEQVFKPFLAQLDIDQTFITHYHEDHTGCAHYLQHERHIPVYMNGLMIKHCSRKSDYPLYRRLFWGNRPSFHAMPISESFSSRNSDWDVIPTPGHAADHLAFLHKAAGQLFTGDLFCQARTKVVLREENIPAIIDSLKKVLQYDFDEVFCAHAGYLPNGRAALFQKLEYLLELKEKIITLYNEGLSPQEIDQKVFPKKYPITRLSNGEWNSLHIVNSFLKECTVIK